MTNFEGRYVVNIIFDTLEAENLEKILLLPEGIQLKHDNVLIFISDAVSYMAKE